MADPLRKLLSPDEIAANAAVLAPNQMPQTPDVFGSFLMHPQRDAQGNVQPDLPNPMQDQLDRVQHESDASAQAQFENTDPAMLQKQQRQSDLALAPEKLKNQNAIDIENLKAKNATDVEAQKADILGKALEAKNTAETAKQNAPTNQIRTQATYAKNAMDLIGTTDSQVSDPELTPYIGNIVGRMTGLGTENVNLPGDFAMQMTANPALQKKLGDFGFNLVAAVSAIARAHNQRGATKELTQQFGSQIRASATPAMLHGALQSAHALMQGYAANDPGLGVQNPYPTDPLGQTLGMKADPAGVR